MVVDRNGKWSKLNYSSVFVHFIAFSSRFLKFFTSDELSFGNLCGEPENCDKDRDRWRANRPSKLNLFDVRLKLFSFFKLVGVKILNSDSCEKSLTLVLKNEINFFKHTLKSYRVFSYALGYFLFQFQDFFVLPEI